MAVLGIAGMVDRISDTIESRLTAPSIPGPWRRSRYSPSQFGRESEIEHHGFVVWAGTSEPLTAGFVSRANTYRTEIHVRWGHRLRPEAVAYDMSQALQAEDELVEAVLCAPPLPVALHLSEASRDRDDGRDGLVYVGTVSFEVIHFGLPGV